MKKTGYEAVWMILSGIISVLRSMDFWRWWWWLAANFLYYVLGALLSSPSLVINVISRYTIDHEFLLCYLSSICRYLQERANKDRTFTYEVYTA